MFNIIKLLANETIEESTAMIEVDGTIVTAEELAKQINSDPATTTAMAKQGQGCRIVSKDEALGRLIRKDLEK